MHHQYGRLTLATAGLLYNEYQVSRIQPRMRQATAPLTLPSFIINIKLLGVFVFLNIALILLYFCSLTLFVVDD